MHLCCLEKRVSGSFAACPACGSPCRWPIIKYKQSRRRSIASRKQSLVVRRDSHGIESIISKMIGRKRLEYSRLCGHDVSLDAEESGIKNQE